MRTIVLTLALVAFTTATAEAQWTTARSWSGQGIQSTESFSVSDREWRIRWQSRASGNAGILQIMVHDASTDELVSLAANVQGSDSNTSYVRHTPGRFYLDINSANTEWRVEVQTRSGQSAQRADATPGRADPEPEPETNYAPTSRAVTASMPVAIEYGEPVRNGFTPLAGAPCSMEADCNPEFVQVAFITSGTRHQNNHTLQLVSGQEIETQWERIDGDDYTEELIWANISLDDFQSFVRTGGNSYRIGGTETSLSRGEQQRLRIMLDRIR